jgi:NADH:ubiquinone oxidoreductase subunit D
MRIVEQALREIPLGSISLEDPRVVIPEKEKVYNSIEGLMHHFKIIMEGIRVPPGEVYFCPRRSKRGVGLLHRQRRRRETLSA